MLGTCCCYRKRNNYRHDDTSSRRPRSRVYRPDPQRPAGPAGGLQGDERGCGVLLSNGRHAGLHPAGMRLSGCLRGVYQARGYRNRRQRDSLERHRAFAASQSLPFLLLSDQRGSLRKAFQVPKTLAILPSRVTFVIDKQGVIRHVFSALFSGQEHVTEALRIVRELAKETSIGLLPHSQAEQV